MGQEKRDCGNTEYDFGMETLREVEEASAKEAYASLLRSHRDNSNEDPENATRRILQPPTTDTQQAYQHSNESSRLPTPSSQGHRRQL